MSARFTYSVVTPDGAARTGSSELLVVPTPSGELGIMAGHAPLLAGIAEGTVRSTLGGSTESFGVGGGVVEVRGGAVTLMVLRCGSPTAR